MESINDTLNATGDINGGGLLMMNNEDEENKSNLTEEEPKSPFQRGVQH